MTKKVSYNPFDYEINLESIIYEKRKKRLWITFSLYFQDDDLECDKYNGDIPISRIRKMLRNSENQKEIMKWGLDCINCLEMYTSELDIEFCYKQEFIKTRTQWDGFCHIFYYHK